MKAEVIVPFFDLEKGDRATPENSYYVGDIYEGTAARINGLVEKGHVRKIETPRTAKKQPTRKRAAKK